MARYLLAASPLPGHVMPMVQIGHDLARRGHDVTVVTGAAYVAGVRAGGLRATAMNGADRAESPRVSRIGARMPTLVRRCLSGRAELRSVFVAPLRDQWVAVRDAVTAGPVDAVLADIAFTGVLPSLLSDAPRPPILLCGLGPLTVSSRDTPPFGMAWQPEPARDYRRMTAVAHRALFGDVRAEFDRALRGTGAPPSPVFVTDWVRLADGVLQLSVPGFEYPRSDLPDHVRFVGPLPPAADPSFRPPAWWPDVEAARFVVHVTQGTFDNGDLDQLIGPTLTALAGRDDVLVVASTGGRSTEGLRGAIPGNARVAEWIPYEALMKHVDVTITNGGYGGVHHALRAGVPLIAAGESSDKAEIAARIEFCGAGIDLGTATPSPGAIAAAVDRISSNGTHRVAAARLAAEIGRTRALDVIAEELDRLHTGASGDVTVA